MQSFVFLFSLLLFPILAHAHDFEQEGDASWYGPGFHGRTAANGEPFDQNQPTAAHPTLPLGTEATVTNLENGKSVDVTITDRGPYVDGRVIDLSKAAAEEIDMTDDGVVPVLIQADPPAEEKGGAKDEEVEQAER